MDIKKLFVGLAVAIGGVFIFLKGEGYVRDRGIIGKLTREEVNYSEPYYVPLTKRFYKCENCMHFVVPRSCKLVEGDISPEAGCNRWIGVKAYKRLELAHASPDAGWRPLEFGRTF